MHCCPLLLDRLKLTKFSRLSINPLNNSSRTFCEALIPHVTGASGLLKNVTKSHLGRHPGVGCFSDICRQFERHRQKMSPRLQFVLNAIRDGRLVSCGDPSVPGECLAIYRDPSRLLSSTIARARQSDGRTGPGSGDKRENIAPVRKITGHCPRVSAQSGRIPRPRAIVERAVPSLVGNWQTPVTHKSQSAGK